MSTNQSFHEVRFPVDLALGATAGPRRRTEIITLGSGREQRNSRWAHSRRQYNAGYGVKTIADLQTVIAFFEERRGRLFGFRFRDPIDWKSAPAGQAVSALDQILGIGDGSTATFQLVKQYGSLSTGYTRTISKPVEGSVVVAVNQTTVSADQYELDLSTGEITFVEGHIPQSQAVIECGYEFDVPVRFDTDEISVNLSHFDAGEIPSIPLVELLS